MQLFLLFTQIFGTLFYQPTFLLGMLYSDIAKWLDYCLLVWECKFFFDFTCIFRITDTARHKKTEQYSSSRL